MPVPPPVQNLVSLSLRFIPTLSKLYDLSIVTLSEEILTYCVGGSTPAKLQSHKDVALLLEGLRLIRFPDPWPFLTEISLPLAGDDGTLDAPWPTDELPPLVRWWWCPLTCTWFNTFFGFGFGGRTRGRFPPLDLESRRQIRSAFNSRFFSSSGSRCSLSSGMYRSGIWILSGVPRIRSMRDSSKSRSAPEAWDAFTTGRGWEWWHIRSKGSMLLHITYWIYLLRSAYVRGTFIPGKKEKHEEITKLMSNFVSWNETIMQNLCQFGHAIIKY